MIHMFQEETPVFKGRIQVHLDFCRSCLYPLSPRFNTSEVTLSGLAGGEYLPLPASKGPAFPLRSAELTSKPAHPRWVPHFSGRLRSWTMVFSKN